jgi:S-DNA-T family DNA segregation ATPase FtsK/SpoIIIE
VATISTLSRRASEFTGVALFAGALIWLIALVTHEPSDPVWFFTAGDGHAAANFVGLVGAFLSEASLQVFGYASFVVPALLAVAGWNFFWCRQLDAAYTKLIGAGLFFSCFSALLALVIGSTELNGRTFRAGGYVGEWIADMCSA